ncbi:hypothetical protein D6T64_11845 [Cryobacterium melibiosiphilum]|uniref:Uncharacterized protein n=1 Tax=Cryobacterium melibiosiphilum TaxID=995039 RepID=A0A3A5MG38_9MICO|nr:hypothetical protein [Cryobacterium melibiosiphilum]RJT88075.1 hypothetical protein D6T64_11845 [Cryobacterium melibiosiphilum]
MKPLNEVVSNVRISWNGGRNGWHSFLIGAAIIPHRDYSAGKRLDTTLHLYLGLWVLAATVKTKYGRKVA